MASIAQLACNEQGFIFDPSRGDSYVANKTGIFIIDALKAGGDVEQMAVALAQRFDVGDEQVAEDVVEFLAQLKILGLK